MTLVPVTLSPLDLEGGLYHCPFTVEVVLWPFATMGKGDMAGRNHGLWGCVGSDCLRDLAAISPLGIRDCSGCVGGQVPLDVRSTHFGFSHSLSLWKAELTASFSVLAGVCPCVHAYVSNSVGVCAHACWGDLPSSVILIPPTYFVQITLTALSLKTVAKQLEPSLFSTLFPLFLEVATWDPLSALGWTWWTLRGGGGSSGREGRKPALTHSYCCFIAVL